MKITQVIPFVTERYPWTHRVEFAPADQYPVYQWTEDEGIDGLWVGGAFYTTEKVLTIIALKWGHL